MFQTLFGIPAEVVFGWVFALAPWGVIAALLLVITVQQWQIKRGQAYIAYHLGYGAAPRQRRRRGNVVEGPWRRRSG